MNKLKKAYQWYVDYTGCGIKHALLTAALTILTCYLGFYATAYYIVGLYWKAALYGLIISFFMTGTSIYFLGAKERKIKLFQNKKEEKNEQSSQENSSTC